jgi:hypothetical protein
MTKQHTPGPWKYLRTSGFDYGSTAYWVPGICGNVKDEANARLIAAAPDLLEALQHLMVAHGEQLDYAFQQAQEAIAKATGAMK